MSALPAAAVIRDPVVVPPETDVEGARTLMRQHRISGLPVVTSNYRLVGLLTKRDVDFVSGETLVRDVMTPMPLLTAPPDVTREEAFRILSQSKVEKLPLVDADDTLKGMVTLRGLRLAEAIPDARPDGPPSAQSFAVALASLVREECRRSGLSMAQLARLTGIEHRMLHRYIHGNVAPRIENVLAIEHAVGLVPGSLISAAVAAATYEQFAEPSTRLLRVPGLTDATGKPIGEHSATAKYLRAEVRETAERLTRWLASSPVDVHRLTGRVFEEVVAELLLQRGYEVTLTPPTNDGGVDLYAATKTDLGSFLYLVQCKRNAPTNRVGVSVVRDLYGVVMQSNATGGVVVTTSTFTRGARSFRETIPYRLSLRDFSNIEMWLRDVGRPLDGPGGPPSDRRDATEGGQTFF